MNAMLDGRRAVGASGLALLMSPAAMVPAVRPSAATDARVAGRVLTVQGAPATGVKVTIVETDTGYTFPLLNPGRPTRTVAETAAGPDGWYSGPLPGAYVAGYETDSDWVVSAARPAKQGEATGATSSFEFEVNTAVQEAPDLPLWDSTPSVSLDGYRVGVTVPGAPPRGTTPSVFLGSVSTPGTAAVFDLRSHEPDRQGGGASRRTAGATAYASIRVAHHEGRTIYHQRIVTPTVALPSEPPLVPPSRSAPCTVASTDGRVTAAKPCLATDGDLSSVVRQPAPARETTTTTAGVASVTVELDVATEVESVFARRCDRSCVVEVSRDGSAWAKPRQVEIGPPDGDTLIARFTPVADARFVRVSRPGGSLSVAEISAWPARPPGSPAPAATSSQPAVGPAGGAAAAAPGPGRAVPVVAVAASVLLGAVGGALALVVGRGSRRA